MKLRQVHQELAAVRTLNLVLIQSTTSLQLLLQVLVGWRRVGALVSGMP